MADQAISTYHMASNPALYEPSRNNAFRFVLNPALDTLVRAGASEENGLSDDDYLSGNAKTIELAVSQASVPHFSINSIEIRRANSVMKFANVPEFSDFSIKCNDYVGARVKDILMAWQALVYDVSKDVIHTADNYKYDCTLVEYNTDFSKIIRSWRLIGCWVSSLQEGEFDYNSNDKRSIDVNIEYDRAELILD